MSDSDSELAGDLFTFQNDNKIISVRGRNMDASNLTGLSFRNNASSIMPQTIERSRYTSIHEQKSMYYRRETSPMSTMSACDMRQRKINNSYYPQAMSSQRSDYRRGTSPMSTMSACDVRQRKINNSYYPRAMSSQRSVINGRSRSPMSVRSIDSSASCSVYDIVSSIMSQQYSHEEVKLIKEMCIKHLSYNEQTSRNGINKRRKSLRRYSGHDSGDEGSDSSLSSDGRSTRTYNSKYVPSCRSVITNISGSGRDDERSTASSQRRGAHTFSELRKKMRESEIYTDCTDNFKQHSFQNMVGRPVDVNNTLASKNIRKSMVARSLSSIKRIPEFASTIGMQNMKPNSTTMLQKDRFSRRPLLPCRRFNKSIAFTKITENDEFTNPAGQLQRGMDYPTSSNNGVSSGTNQNVESDSDQYDLFSETNNNHKTKSLIDVQKNRNLDSDGGIISLSSQKRTNNGSLSKNNINTVPTEEQTVVNPDKNNKTNDFVFAKPKLPARKFGKEKIISKSATLPDSLEQSSVIPVNIRNSQPEIPVQQEENDQEDELSNATQDTTDLSMRPSFIKRKLFTQRPDFSEIKNTSTDSSSSPQNSIYGAIQKEKNKARKLQQVTTQSCLSRDVQQDENNLVDLIQQIVPLEQMNVTNQTNRTELLNSNNKTDENSDKWDVTSVISTHNNDEEMSDTYTDEEVFNATVKQLETSQARVLVENLPANINMQQRSKSNVRKDEKDNKKVKKSFWDLDESDADCQEPLRNGESKENHWGDNQGPQPASKLQGLSNKFTSRKTTTASTSNASTLFNNTVSNVKITNSTLLMRSHRTTKRKNFFEIEDDLYSTIQVEPQSKKLKIIHAGITPAKNDNNNSLKSKHESPNNNKPMESVITCNKQINNTKQPVKIDLNDPTPNNNNKKDIILSGSAINTNKLKNITESTQKSNAKNQDYTLTEETTKNNTYKNSSRKKQETNKKNQDTSLVEVKTKKNNQNKIEKKGNDGSKKGTAQSKQKDDDTRFNLAETDEQIKEVTNNNKKYKPVQDDTKTNKQIINNKPQNKRKNSPKSKETKKTTINHVSDNELLNKNNSPPEKKNKTTINHNSDNKIESKKNSPISKKSNKTTLNHNSDNKIENKKNSPISKKTNKTTVNHNSHNKIQSKKNSPISKKTNETAVNHADNKLRNKKNSSKPKKTKKDDSTLKENSTTEENNNNSCRSVRSCRSMKQTQSFNKTNEKLDGSLYRSLRTRQIDLSATLNGNITKSNGKVNSSNAKSKPRKISPTLTIEKKVVTKKGLLKRTNSRLLSAKDVDTSVESISLKAESKKSSTNSKTGKKQNEVSKLSYFEKSAQRQDIYISLNESTPRRNRIPNRKYSIR